MIKKRNKEIIDFKVVARIDVATDLPPPKLIELKYLKQPFEPDPEIIKKYRGTQGTSSDKEEYND